MMSELEKALLKATKVNPQKKGEDRQKFLLRVMLGVQKLPDEGWEGLEALDGAQDWYNAATDADNASKPLPEFPDAGAVEDDAEGDAADDEDGADDDIGEGGDEEDEAAAPPPKPGKGAAAKAKADAKKPAAKAKADAKKPAPKAAAAKPAPAKPAAKPQPAAKAKAAAKPAPKKGTSMRRALKMIVIKKPKMPVDELIEQLEKKGYASPSRLTITSIRSDTRDTIKVLNEAGVTDIEL